MMRAQPVTDEPEAGEVPETKFDTSRIIDLSKMVDDGQLSSSAARQVFEAMLESDEPPLAIAERLNLRQVSDEAEIEKIVDAVLEQNQKVADDIKNGELKALGFLVGQVMAASQGKANPQLAQEIIKQKLNL